MKCQKCKTYEAIVEILLTGSKQKVCRECYRRLAEKRLLAVTGKIPKMDRCNKCKAFPNEIIKLRLGYDSNVKLGIYCQHCIKKETHCLVIKK